MKLQADGLDLVPSEVFPPELFWRQLKFGDFDIAELADGRAKLHIVRQGSPCASAVPVLFHGGEYRALYADGGYEEQVIAFALSAGGATMIAVAPRLFARRLGDAAAPVGAFWGEARLALPESEYEDVMTGARHAGGPAPMARLLAEFPVALLLRH